MAEHFPRRGLHFRETVSGVGPNLHALWKRRKKLVDSDSNTFGQVAFEHFWSWIFLNALCIDELSRHKAQQELYLLPDSDSPFCSVLSAVCSSWWTHLLNLSLFGVWISQRLSMLILQMLWNKKKSLTALCAKRPKKSPRKRFRKYFRALTVPLRWCAALAPRTPGFAPLAAGSSVRVAPECHHRTIWFSSRSGRSHRICLAPETIEHPVKKYFLLLRVSRSQSEVITRAKRHVMRILFAISCKMVGFGGLSAVCHKTDDDNNNGDWKVVIHVCRLTFSRVAQKMTCTYQLVVHGCPGRQELLSFLQVQL